MPLPFVTKIEMKHRDLARRLRSHDHPEEVLVVVADHLDDLAEHGDLPLHHDVRFATTASSLRVMAGRIHRGES